MILNKEQYDEMIDDDPFPFYKYDRLSEEEKTLSYLTMNGSEHENLTFAIANFGPQPFRGTFSTNFQPPGFERRAGRYNAPPYRPFQCPSYRPISYPPGLHPSGSLQTGLNPRASPFPSVPARPTVPPRWSSPPSGPSLPNSSRPLSVNSGTLSRLHSTPASSSQPGSQDLYNSTVKPGSDVIPPVRWTSPTTPAHLLPIVGGDSSEDDDEDGEETRPSRQPELDRVTSKSSDKSHETVEMTSERASLTSSRTTPPKA